MKKDWKRSSFKTTEAADLQLIVESFSKCISEDGSISTDHYLCACNQLVRMFHQMGSRLGKVLKDVHKSIRSLEIRRVSGANCYYTNLGLLLKHENDLELSQVKGRVHSGTRSVVNVFHTMTFMLAFLHDLQEAIVQQRSFKGHERTRVYQNTLARHHSRFFQTAAKVILMQSPGRQEMVRNLQRSCHGDRSSLAFITGILDTGGAVQQQVSKLLLEYDLPL